MVPDQQTGAADQKDAPSEQAKPKLGNLSAVEKVVNEYAKKFAKRYRVSEDEYAIVLATGFTRGIMGIRRGPVAQIVLQWPEAQPSINTLLDGAFKLISKKHLVDSMAVEPVFLIRRRAEERRKLIRAKIGNDEADIILDLIPKHRIRTTVTVTVKYEDVVTGESYSVTHNEKPEQYRGQDVTSWLKLSRIVRDRHPEEATRYEPEADESEVPEGTDGNDQSATDGDAGRSTVGM